MSSLETIVPIPQRKLVFWMKMCRSKGESCERRTGQLSEHCSIMWCVYMPCDLVCVLKSRPNPGLLVLDGRLPDASEAEVSAVLFENE